MIHDQQRRRESGDFGYKTGIRDLNNVAPRVGFAYNVGGKNDLVIAAAAASTTTRRSRTSPTASSSTTGRSRRLPAERPGFMENPTRGVTAEDYLSGAVRRRRPSSRIIATDYKNPYSWQSSIGFQKQLGAVDGLDVDLTALEERIRCGAAIRTCSTIRPPATTWIPTIYGRPNPAYGQIQWMESDGETETVLLSSSFTRRFSNNVPGRRDLHADAVEERQHDRLRLSWRTTSSIWTPTGRDRPTTSATRCAPTASSTCRGR